MYSITAWSKLRADLMQADSMTMTKESQLASSVLMIRPARFQSNPQTLDASCDSVVIVIESACIRPARSLLHAVIEYKPGSSQRIYR